MAKLKVFYQNTRGLRTKCLQFKQNLLCNSYDIVVITESWLYDGIYDGEFCDSRYDVFRNDRDFKLTAKTTGGGILILVKKELGARRCDDDENSRSRTEFLSVTVSARSLAFTVDLHIFAAYVPPDEKERSGDINSVVNALTSIYDRYSNHNYLVLGDFNLPQISWCINGPIHQKRGTVEAQVAGKHLVDDFFLLGFTQYNTLKNYAGNTLDLAFSNLPLSITGDATPLVAEDRAHPSFSIEVSDLTVTPLKESSAPRRNFRKGDYNGLNSEFAKVDWDALINNGTVDGACDNLYSLIYATID